MAYLSDIFEQIASRAAADGQEAIAGAARRTTSPGAAERLLVVAWDGNLAPGVVAWVEGESTGVLVEAADPDLIREPWVVTLADRLVAVLPCDKFLDADEFEQIQQFVLSRPQDTFRVLLGASQPPDAETLARAEAGLAHLLRPERMGHSPSGSTASELLLWVDPDARGDLAGRGDRDRATLGEWLRRPVEQAAREELTRQRALELIHALEERREPAAAPATSRPVERRRISELSDQLRQCRRKMLEIIERGVSGVQRELATSLSTFERNLLQEVRTQMRDHLRKVGHSMTLREFQDFINRFLQDRHSTWARDARATLILRAGELSGDMEVFLQGPDWALLDDLVTRQHLGHQYPRDLLAGLRIPEDAIRGLGDEGEGGAWLRGAVAASNGPGTGDHRSGGFGRGGFVLQTHWLGALCGGALTAVTAFWLLPFGPLGVLFGAGAGALSGVYASRQLMDSADIDQALNRVERAIVETAQQSLESLNLFTRDVASRLRATLEEQFAQIEDVMARAMNETPVAATTIDEGVVSLDRLREAVLATSPSP